MHKNTETYSSYGNVYTSTAEVFRPQNKAALRLLLAKLTSTSRKITVAGGFNSFDQQNGSRDAVISLQNFDHISYNSDEHTITVGAGATWGNILKVVYENKSVLHTCITGSAPTAGGTLSIHANSTFTPSMGKEGKHCLSFDIMLVDGTILTCSRTQNKELFYGAIGGFGLLGFIIQITYKVFHVGSHYKIDFSAKDYDDLNDLTTAMSVREALKIDTLEDIRSQGCLFYLDGKNPKYSAYDRNYVRIQEKKKGNRFIFGVSTLLSGIWRLFPSLPNIALKKDGKRPVKKRLILKGLDAIKEGTFWAQPDYVWTKHIGRYLEKLGHQPKLYQHSYFIPDEGNKVIDFTRKAFELFEQYNLKFFMFDVSYLPKDEPFLLSSSRKSGGFYVNSTFMNNTNKVHLLQCYHELNQLAYQMEGNLNLGKNIFVQPDLLEKMFATNLEELVYLKQKYDPSNCITSTFFEENFPSYARAIKSTQKATSTISKPIPSNHKELILQLKRVS